MALIEISTKITDHLIFFILQLARLQDTNILQFSVFLRVKPKKKKKKKEVNAMEEFHDSN